MSNPRSISFWPWPPLLRGSLLLHVAAAAGVAARPAWWPAALGAVIADHLLITAAGLWPRSELLGPNWVHLPAAAGSAAVALTFDDGPDPDVTPQLLALLAAHAVPATFFCIGERVARYPQLARAIVAQGHTLGNHSYTHSAAFSLLGPHAQRADVERCQEVIRQTTGTIPEFFRAPAGLRNVFLAPVLARADLQLVSWTRRGFDTVTCEPARVLRALTRNLHGGDILLLHDGHAARTAAGRPVLLEVLPPLLAAIAGAGLAPITLHAARTHAAARTGPVA
jgi:peptidoglycan-N-acetylglucosamine deacetylase